MYCNKIEIFQVNSEFIHWYTLLLFFSRIHALVRNSEKRYTHLYGILWVCFSQSTGASFDCYLMFWRNATFNFWSKSITIFQTHFFVSTENVECICYKILTLYIYLCSIYKYVPQIRKYTSILPDTSHPPLFNFVFFFFKPILEHTTFIRHLQQQKCDELRFAHCHRNDKLNSIFPPFHSVTNN